VTPERVQKLKGIPIFLFSGSENMAWSPESTDLSYELLKNTFGGKNYEREVVEGYGHLDCWMGTRFVMFITVCNRETKANSAIAIGPT
jgi:hypothetical protein